MLDLDAPLDRPRPLVAQTQVTHDRCHDHPLLRDVHPRPRRELVLDRELRRAQDAAETWDCTVQMKPLQFAFQAGFVPQLVLISVNSKLVPRLCSTISLNLDVQIVTQGKNSEMNKSYPRKDFSLTTRSKSYEGSTLVK